MRGILVFAAAVTSWYSVHAETSDERKKAGRSLHQGGPDIPWFAPTPSIRPPSQPCSLSVGLVCRTWDGSLCETVNSVSEEMCSSQGRLDVLTFQFKPANCNMSSNKQDDGVSHCSDTNDFPSDGEELIINCRSYDDKRELVVQPSSVVSGDFFTVQNNRLSRPALPDKIDCIIRSNSGNIYQRNIFDASREFDLQLKDSFGAFVLMACDRMSCMDTFFFDLTLANTGSTIATITSVQFNLNQREFDVMNELDSTRLVPGRVTSIQGTADVDVCGGDAGFDASASVKGLSPDGQTTCGFIDRYVGIYL